jgi:histidinol dehydrogenase
MAPEHVVCDSTAVATRLTRAGTVFVGPYSAQSSGDYVTGSNHVLPTSGAAAARGGLSAADFVRISSVQRLTASGLERLAPSAIALAEAEGLRAHAASLRIRIQS